MNLVQLADDLEFVPKEQLAQMSQDPNSNYPPYLVLSEIQRRTMNEKAYAAAQPQPTTTVAEEVVGEFMQPQGLQAGMPPESAPTDVFSSGMSGMPASAPMQQPMQMASGGPTGYLKGGQGTISVSPPSKINQAMYGLENMASSYVNPYSGQIRSGLDAVGNMGIGDQVVNPNALNFLNNANNTLDRVVSGTVGALVPGGRTPFRDMLERRRARQSSGQEAYDENVEALSRSDERSDRASGGSTSYFEGGPTDLTDQQYYSGGLRDFNDRLRNQSRIDAAQTSAQTAVTEGLDAAGQPLMSSQLVNQNIEPDEMEMDMGMAGGGLTAYANGGPLEQSFSDPMRQAMLAQLGFPSNMTDEELNAAIMEQRKMSDISSGSNAPKTAGDLGDAAFEFMYGDEFGDEAMDYIGSIPVGGVAIKGIQKSIPYVSKAAKGLRDYFKKGKFKDTKLPDVKVKGDVKARTPGGVIRETIQEAGEGRKYIQPIIDNPLTSSLVATAGLGAINRSTDKTVNPSDPFFRQNEDGTFTNTYTEELNKQKKQADLAAKQKAITDEANAKERLRIEAIEKAERKDRGYDLAQLGGLIMGSKSLGDLGMGIAGMAQQKQARETAGKELDLKTRLTEAQILQIEDKAKYSQTDALQLLISTTEKNITELLDAGVYTQKEAIEELKKLEPQKAKLRQLLQNMFGDMQVSNVGSDEQFLKSLSA